MTHIKPCILTVDLYNTYRERMPEYVQYDRQIPLEITVMAHGKPADLTGMFARISIGKPDGHHVYHDNVEVAGNIISTTFGDQEFVTAGLVNVTIDLLDGDGSKVALIPFMIRVKPAVITDETIKSSNDYQTIMALIEDVRSLDEMFHVEQDNRAEDFAIQMSQQAETHNAIIAQLDQAKNAHEVAFQDQMDKHNSEFTDAQTQRTNSFDIQMSEWNNAISEQERQRETAEAKRANAENARDNKETERKQNELARETAEQQRVDAESDRKRSEATRNQDEAIRKSNESNRKTYENDRQSEEEKRIASEIERVNNESKRTTNELARITAEADRANQESTRMATESKRATAESARVATESKRATAEKVRVNQEEARRLAEEGRTTRMATWEAKAEKMAQETQEMVSSAQSFINANESRLLEDNARTDYMGNAHNSIKDVMDANVEFVLDEVNTVHYEGQHITATDTVARQVKHATLKGQTLVNLCPNKVIDYMATSDWDGFNGLGQSSNTQNYSWKTLQDLKPNTKYFISCYVETFDVGEREYYLFNNNNQSTVFEDTLTIYQTGLHKWVLTSRREFTDKVFIALRCQNAYARGTIKIKNIMIIEYQDGMENWDIPYFKDMASVKAPTVKMTGKNLFGSNEVYRFTSVTGERTYADITKICKGFIGRTFEHGVIFRAKITKENLVSVGPHHFGLDICFQCSDGTEVWSGFTIHNLGGMASANNQTFTYYNRQLKGKTIIDVKECNIFMRNLTGKFEMRDIEMYDGTLDNIPLTYEPYKSNTLTLPEEVVLRSLTSEVCDIYNARTGEYVRRIGESSAFDVMHITMPDYMDNDSCACLIVLKSSELPCKRALGGYGAVTCDRLPRVNVVWGSGSSQYGISTVNTHYDFAIRLPNSETGITASDTAEQAKAKFRTWLSKNPIKVQYELATPIITTIDLQNQKVYSYDSTTHYTCSSAERTPIPMLSIDVPTNLPALVSRQRNTIQELKKENKVLKEEVLVVDRQRENGDLELLSSDFDIDFRLMEIEFALGVPMIATFKEMRSTARTSYEMAKALILGDKYEHSDMEYKLGRYLERKQITQDQHDELIALMNANELI